ncbi:hypothetical protein NQ317_010522 [Molorchus minor]|uniref:UDP-glucuronosyltransferase n=1 Tax=Molorchus minor TaxID=1323400 RepID=A0ABQ9IS27_9CUCU|nr:hypothetical protein NQ317_010522 [Molorchus minor]
MLIRLLLILLICYTIQETTCAKILAVVPVPSYSHQLFFRRIWKELGKRGHELTLLTTDPMQDNPENIRQINWSFTYALRHNKYNITKVVQDNEYNLPKILASYQAMLNEIVDEELSHPDIQTLLKNESEHFDLLLVEYLHPTLYAFSSGLSVQILLPFERDLSFKERLLSTLYSVYSIYKSNDDVAEEIAKKHFGQDLPPLEIIIKNVSMVFLNTHPVFNVRPLGPGFIHIGGGIHLEDQNPLPKELKIFLDSAKEGVIYFSLGTNVRSHHLKSNFIKIVVDTFKELRYKVLWKFEIDIPEKSNNVKILQWVPQQDVLRHENVRVFITQCGIQSMEESILSHVPMISIPFVSDQKMNSLKIANRGLGIALNKNTVTKDSFKAAIIEIMNNSSYRDKVREVANLIRDEPMSGLEKAIWWTEYVIRHKGVKHFWHPNVDLPLYQYLLLDVIGFFTLVIAINIFILYKITCKTLNIYRQCSKKHKVE